MTVAPELVAIGFDDENGALSADARVEIAPAGNMFFEERITAASGAISVVVHESAIKVIRESTSLAADR